MTTPFSYSPNSELVLEFNRLFPFALNNELLDDMLEAAVVSIIYKTVALRNEAKLQAQVNELAGFRQSKTQRNAYEFLDDELRLLSLRKKPELAGDNYNSILNHQRMVAVFLGGRQIQSAGHMWTIHATGDSFYAEHA